MAGENWWITVERFVRQFGQVVDIDDYLARIATYLTPPPTVPAPRYPSPRELPAALDYLNTVWRLRFGTRLLLLDSAERTCTLALDIDTAEEFDARLTALGDIFKSFQVGATPGVSGHPVDRIAAFLLTHLDEVAAHRVDRAVGVLRAIVDIRNGSQHSNASPQAANALVQLDLAYPVVNWATAWYQVRAHAVEALDALREEIQANAPEASG